MSHRATNWAIEQRGLKPATKIVLWHLCDRHNPDRGCFPRQDRLAEDCEMSRASLNTHLKILEDAGLIHRKQRKNAGGKQASTLYQFPFETGQKGPENEPDMGPNDGPKPSPDIGHGEAITVSRNEGEPCPENSENRVQILDSNNPVREPVREPVTLSGDASENEREMAAPAGKEEGNDCSQPEKPQDVERAFDLAWHGYDQKLKSSRTRSLAEWLKLDPDAREVAARRITPFKTQWAASGGTPSMIPAFSTYLADRRFEQVDDPAVDQPTEPDGRQKLAKCGKAWGVVRLNVMRKQQPVPVSDSLMEPKRSHARWPYLAALDGPVVQYLPAERAVPEAVLDRCQKVKVGSAEWNAWADYHTAKDWLMPPVREGVEWIWFPARVPREWTLFEEDADTRSPSSEPTMQRAKSEPGESPRPRSEGHKADSVSADNQEIA